MIQGYNFSRQFGPVAEVPGKPGYAYDEDPKLIICVISFELTQHGTSTLHTDGQTDDLR